MRIENARVFTYTTDATLTAEQARNAADYMFKATRDFLHSINAIKDDTQHYVSYTVAQTVTSPFDKNLVKQGVNNDLA
jgi:hypothetical protein